MNADERRFDHTESTQKIIGVFYDVYNELGFGFVESVYETAMAKALRDAGIRVERQPRTQVFFRGEIVGEFRADLLVEEIIPIELKTTRAIDTSHEGQTLNFLRSTAFEVGLLLNFGPKPEVRRFAFSNERKPNLNLPPKPQP